MPDNKPSSGSCFYPEYARIPEDLIGSLPFRALVLTSRDEAALRGLQWRPSGGGLSPGHCEVESWWVLLWFNGL